MPLPQLHDCSIHIVRQIKSSYLILAQTDVLRGNLCPWLCEVQGKEVRHNEAICHHGANQTIVSATHYRLPGALETFVKSWLGTHAQK